jgi:hypothetical protein
MKFKKLEIGFPSREGDVEDFKYSIVDLSGKKDYESDEPFTKKDIFKVTFGSKIIVVNDDDCFAYLLGPITATKRAFKLAWATYKIDNGMVDEDESGDW